MRGEPLPTGWSRKAVGDLFDMQLGKMLSKQASAGPEPRDYIANRHVQWDRVDLSNLDSMRFSATERAKYRLLPGDLLVCEGGEVGRTALWLGEQADVYYQKAIHRLRVRGGGILAGFMLRYMRYAADRGMFTDLSSQTSIAHLTQEKLALLRVTLPPLPEQRRIAEILDTLDEAIRKTEQVIAKLQQMKQGLLHDLLTRGIDENGELRDPERHPEQFKDSPLGRIPRGWERKTIGGLLDGVIDFRGRTPRKLGMHWGGGRIPALSAKNVRMGGVDLTLETYYGSGDLYKRWMTKGHARRGDVLLTMEAPLGNVAQIPDNRQYILSQRVVLLKFCPPHVTNDFMATQMRHYPFQANLRRWSTGTTATGIQRAKLVLVPAVVPPLAEQQRITSSVRAAESRLADEQAAADKLRTLKQGLMDDLLTGRVRVPVPDEGGA